VVTDGGLEVVGSPHAQDVAGIAGNETGLGKAWVEVQLFAQLGLGQIDFLRGANRCDRFGGQCRSTGGSSDDRRDKGFQSHVLAPWVSLTACGDLALTETGQELTSK